MPRQVEGVESYKVRSVVFAAFHKLHNSTEHTQVYKKEMRAFLTHQSPSHLLSRAVTVRGVSADADIVPTVADCK